MNIQSIKRLLLVEDELGFARFLREMFKEQGSAETELTHVENMADAEEQLGGHTFDIILLDPGLPDSQGIESVQRAHAAAPRVPLVVLTGRDDESLALLALQEGAQDYLIKGQIDTRGLLRFLRYAVERNVMEEQLRVVGEELERSNRELQDFATIASHDLQEPLRKIQAFGDRLAEHSAGALDEEAADYLLRMTNAAGRMQALINDLLEYSQVTIRPQPPRPVDLGLVVTEVLSDLDERIRVSNGHVYIGPLPTILASPMQMRQLFQNLIANALKFHPADVAPEVHIEAVSRGDGRGPKGRRDRPSVWEIRVRDNGIGFEEKHVERIFAPFQRLHGRQAYEGTGMGLAICRRIVALLGGTLTATSQPGAGATFVITLPRSAVVVDALAPVA
ncbi:MAG: ATP-binding protein [Chloroflexota bacterium]|nr:ATP-binding protein [Chloroflexota bacterium]